MASQLGKNTIIESVRIRRETDDIMSALWILSPLLGVVAFFGILFGSLFLGGTLGRTSGTSLGLAGESIAGFIAGRIIAIILFVLAWYGLLKRRNGQVRSDQLVREERMQCVLELAAGR